MPKRNQKQKLSARTGLVGLGILIVLALVVHTYYIRQLVLSSDELHTQTIKDVLIDSVRELNKPLVTDFATGRQAIPAQRLVLPAKTETKIFYRSGSDDSVSIWLIDASNQMQAINKMRSAESLDASFKEVNIAQQCSRQIVLAFTSAIPSDSSDKLTLKKDKKLADGRTVHIYQNECPYGADRILHDLDNLQSY